MAIAGKALINAQTGKKAYSSSQDLIRQGTTYVLPEGADRWTSCAGFSSANGQSNYYTTCNLQCLLRYY